MKTIFTFLFISILLLSSKAQTASVPDKTYGITFSIPWVNNYRYVDYQLGTTEKKTGFFGLGIAGYCKIGKNKLSFNTGFTQDLSSPIGAVDYSKEGKQTHIGSSFGEIILHRPIYEDLSFITGLNFTSYHFQFIPATENSSPKTKTDDALGLSLGLEYRFNKTISFASIYRPAIASFETDEIYRHLISFDIRIDLDFKKKLATK